jgi:hypothetical protein
MLNTMTETVRIFPTSQRVGEGESPILLERFPKITPESRAEVIVSFAGFPPLQGTHMLVCSIGGTAIACAFVLCMDEGAFCL